MNDKLMIMGIVVDPKLANVRQAQKFKQGRKWVLAGTHGSVLAKFSSDEEPELWWKLFQKSQGRRPARLKMSPPKDTDFIYHLGQCGTRKFRERAKWVLSNMGGSIFATFDSEAELDGWWNDFQIRIRLNTQNTMIQRNQRNRKKRRKLKKHKELKLVSGPPPARQQDTTQEGGATRINQSIPNDPMKPISEKYDMPEYDAEHFGRM
jgi:hypothetical protein